MATEAEIIASNVLASAIEYKRLYDTTKNNEYKVKEQRLRKIAENIKLIVGSSSSSAVSSFNGRTGAVTLTATDVNGALGYTAGDMLKSVYDYDNDGVVDSAERTEIIVRNSTGSTLTKGTVVYLSGATGNRPNALRAQADSEATSSKTFGFVVSDIPNNSDGYVACAGTLHDLDTSAFADGVSLWLSPTVAGGWTTTVPSEPNHSVFLGYVARSHPTQGRIVILIQNGYELNELHDVVITTPSNGQLLRYNDTAGYWENWTHSFLTSVPTLDQVTTAGNTTTNAITVGGLVVDTNTLVVDSVNNRVGIGTTSPAYNLQILDTTSGTPQQLDIRNTTSAARAAFTLTNDLGNSFYMQIAGSSYAATSLRNIPAIASQGTTVPAFMIATNWESSTGGTTQLRFVTGGYNNTPTMTITAGNTGNVLINTTTDAGYKLDVNGTGAFRNTLTVFSENEFRQDGISSYITSRYGIFFLRGWSTGTQTASFNGWNQRSYINTPLNIGSSSTTMASMLSVYGSRTASAALAQGVYFNNTLVAAANNDVLVGLDINPTFTNGAFTGVANHALRIQNGQLYINRTFTGVNNAAFQFDFTSTSGYNSGSVSIGQYYNTTQIALANGTSSSQIQLSGANLIIQTQNVGSLTFNSRYHTFDTSLASGFVEWKFQTISAMKLFSTGNLTLGYTSPTDAGYKLDVNGTFRSNNSVYLATASGSVGIGTTTPNYILDVYQTNVKAQIRSTGENQNATLFLGTPFGGTSSPKVAIIARAKTSWSRADLAFCLSDNQSSNSVEATISDLRMVILSDGKVGVNVANPTYQFQVSGDIALSGNLVPTAGSQTLGTFTNRFGDVWAGGLIVGSTFYGDNHQSASGTLYFKDGGGVEKMRMTSVGNFLIGTITDTGEKLQVNGTVRASAFAIGATAGWTGTINIPTNPPGQQNIEVQGGIITNVS